MEIKILVKYKMIPARIQDEETSYPVRVQRAVHARKGALGLCMATFTPTQTFWFSDGGHYLRWPAYLEREAGWLNSVWPGGSG